MGRTLETGLPSEHFDVFEVTQITRGTPLESVVAADLVTVEPGRASEVHRHNGAETLLLILDGSGPSSSATRAFACRRGPAS
jgi:hypothetical protein